MLIQKRAQVPVMRHSDGDGCAMVAEVVVVFADGWGDVLERRLVQRLRPVLADVSASLDGPIISGIEFYRYPASPYIAEVADVYLRSSGKVILMTPLTRALREAALGVWRELRPRHGLP